jgi:hypothetical protein
MSADHWRYRDGWGGWTPFEAEGHVTGGSSVSLLPGISSYRSQPIGFRGANPGQSLDDRGLPRVRVKAVGRKV